MSDDNQKFLKKFKDQISTMGKDGILGTDNNNISSLSNTNNTINSTFNKNNCVNTKAIFKNSFTNKNTTKKGSAFLKPINKEKINNKNEQCQNNSNDINIMNNPYTSNPHMKNNNNVIYNPSMYYYQYQFPNPYIYFNYNNNNNNNNQKTDNNHSDNNININYPQQRFSPPYQLYNYPNIYFNNSNINNPYPYIQQNNNTNTNDNINNGDIKMNKKKKLRPISAQMVGRTKSYMNKTNTTINTNYGNKSNITTITNMTSKYDYKPYTLKDYKEIINVDTLGGLGANIGTEEWEKKKEKMDKMSEYSKNIFKKTKTHNNSKIRELDKIIAKNKQKKDELSTRRRANEYSKLIRPKSSGQCKINKQKKYMKDNNMKIIDEKMNENNNNNDIHYLQGKYALIQQKKLNNEKEYNTNYNYNFNYNHNLDNIYKNNNNYMTAYDKENGKENEKGNKNDKISTKVELKDIFNDNIEEDDEEEKKLLEYYNKFKICTDVIINDDENNEKNNNKEKDKENNNEINNDINNDSLEIKNKVSNNDINNDSLEIDNNDNNSKNENKDEEMKVQVQKEGTDNNLVKKYKTFKEQMNAVNSRSKNNNYNNIRFMNDNNYKNKDNNVCDEYENKNEDKNENKNLEDIQSLLMAREKYLKEVEEIKKGIY